MKNFCHTFRSLLAVLLAPALFCGCHHSTDSEKLVGQWSGASRTGNISLPADWQFRRGGTETLTLTLPQGLLIAEGTWSVRSGSLSQYTTNRVIEISGQQKKVLLVSPMETIYHYTLSGDRLTLTRPEASETIMLVRYVK
jgi:hypothetical protein